MENAVVLKTKNRGELYKVTVRCPACKSICLNGTNVYSFVRQCDYCSKEYKVVVGSAY